MKNYFLILIQLIFGAFMRIWVKWQYGKLEIVNHGFSAKNNECYILTANHISKDDFVITSMIPGTAKFKLMPYRGLVSDQYFNNILFRIFFKMSGCFSTSEKRNNGKKSLELAEEFLKRGETVLIFPEGKVNKDKQYNSKIRPKVGAIYLHKKIINSRIIPVKIEHLPGKKLKVTFKKPLEYKNIQKDLLPKSKELIKEIYK